MSFAYLLSVLYECLSFLMHAACPGSSYPSCLQARGDIVTGPPSAEGKEMRKAEGATFCQLRAAETAAQTVTEQTRCSLPEASSSVARYDW